ncbi:hypothetical protein RvY_00934 [Ramazzottius varieornatus]|uniref:Uncharacterized protein n=1 Tax=Ramazzottius varieornatus TaxID=947166 RepID=A0A1D1UI53_RAMVA|nr:hypothetical protein RvY_00934 [Ramazzottius varieornatus]
MEASTSRAGRARPLHKMPVSESLPDDSECELEALFELNMDAAYGELPIEAPLLEETAFEPEDVITPDVASAPAEVSVAPSDNPAQNAPSASVTSASKVHEKPKKQPAKARQKPRSNVPDISLLPFTLASIEDEEVPGAEPGLRVRTYEGHDLDKEAIDALLGGLTPFIANDHGPRTDVVYPVALPLPSTTAADTSALREFRKDMRRPHLNQGNSRALDRDLTRLLDELRDDQGIHLQLPAISFNLPRKQVGDTPFFAEVGVLEADPSDPRLLHLRSESLDRKWETDFDISQHNVPTCITDAFFFKDSNEVEGSHGTVVSKRAELTLSLSGRSNVAETTDKETGLAKKRNTLLDRKRSSEPNSSGSRKKTVNPVDAILIEKMPTPPPLLPPVKRLRKPSTSR